MFIRPIQKLKCCNCHFISYKRDISFIIYIHVISTDDGRNCRPKHVVCIGNKWMLEYLWFSINMIIIYLIKSERLYILSLSLYIYICNKANICRVICTVVNIGKGKITPLQTRLWPRARRGERSTASPCRTLPPGKDPVPIVQKVGWSPGAVWTGVENLAQPGFDPRTTNWYIT
jgi:hypothetical protein